MLKRERRLNKPSTRSAISAARQPTRPIWQRYSSGALWKKLSEEDRKIFTDVAQEAAAKATAEIKTNEAKLVDFFKQKGRTVTEVTKDECRDTVLKSVSFDPVAYRRRNIIERAFCGLKDWRRVATRYD